MSGYDDRNPVARALGRPVRWMQILCGWALIAICFATLYDIVARRLFNHSVQGVNEVGAYLLAIVSAFGFASALLQKAHTRVDFLFPYMPKLMVSVLNLLAMVTLALLAAVSAWYGYTVLDESLLFDSRAAHAAADADVDPADALDGRALPLHRRLLRLRRACARPLRARPGRAGCALRAAHHRGPDRRRDAGHAAADHGDKVGEKLP